MLRHHLTNSAFRVHRTPTLCRVGFHGALLASIKKLTVLSCFCALCNGHVPFHLQEYTSIYLLHVFYCSEQFTSIK